MKKLCSLLLAAASLFAGSQVEAQERTLAIVKPDAVKANHIGDVLGRYEKAGFRIGAVRMLQLSESDAREFYAVHTGKPFFEELVKFMSSGPCVAVVLEGDNAVKKNRELIGDVDKPGTLRGDYATNKSYNAVHGSDSLDNAKVEIGFFFPAIDVQDRF